MSLITAKGNQAKESASAKKVDFDKVYIRPKDGDTVRVRILGITDRTLAEYKAHSDYKKGIYTTPCIEPTGEECPYCVASNSGVEGWDKFYARKRYLIVFYDIDSETLRVWDASKQHGESMINLIEEYAENKDDMAFTLKRTGSGASDTSYHLMPILKLDKKGKELFDKSADVEVPENFFDTVLVPRTRKQMIQNLEKAGFPVEDFFPDYVSEDEKDDADGVESIADEDIENM